MKNDAAHVWFQEHIQAYLTEGLEGPERERFEAHLSECEAEREGCAAAFELAQEEDQELKAMFEHAVPTPGFEDRILRRLREAKSPSFATQTISFRIAAGVAAVFLCGGIGYVATQTMESGRFEFPLLAKASLRSEVQAPVDVVDQNGFGSKSFEAPIDVNETHLITADEMAEQKAGTSLGQLFARTNDTASVLRERDTESKKSSHGGTYRGPSDTVPPMPDLANANVDGVAMSADSNQFYSLYVAQGAQQESQEKSTVTGNSGSYESVGLGSGSSAGLSDEVRKRALMSKPGDLSAAANRMLVDRRSESKSQNSDKAPTEETKFQRKIIRNGEMEFEVDSFDSSFVQISKIVGEEGGFISSTNSEKLANGKVRGTIVVRVSPDNLDVLVLKLRALGELKSQKIFAQDITKAYTDLESQLRAARAMETRLLEMIKSGKGEIKDLLAAEKELGVWREKIEKVEGEIRYYNNLVSLSTLNITLQEKELRTPTSATEIEKINMGIESEDVEKAYADALKAIADAKGRITKSEMKKFDAGQLTAQIECETNPENAGPLTDRLKQLGNLARMDVGRSQNTQGGTGRPTIPVEKKDTQFSISLYNLINVAPRETAYLDLACSDVEAVYRTILERLGSVKSRVLSSDLNRQKQEQSTAKLIFEVSQAEAEAVLSEVKLRGEILKFNIRENLDPKATRSKRGFQVQLYGLGRVSPRETFTMKLAAKNASEAHRKLLEEVQKAKGRVINSQLAEEDKNNITGYLDFEIAKEDEDAMSHLIVGSGDMVTRKVIRASEDANAVESKIRVQLEIINANKLPPRETTVLGIEVSDVDEIFGRLQAETLKQNGRVVESHLSREKSGRIVGKIVSEVPLANGNLILEEVKKTGTVRMIQSSRDPQVPEGALTRARLEFTISNAQFIVPNDQGFGATLRNGLSKSFAGLMWSLQLIIVGICLIGPWLFIGWAIMKFIRRRRNQTPAAK